MLAFSWARPAKVKMPKGWTFWIVMTPPSVLMLRSVFSVVSAIKGLFKGDILALGSQVNHAS